MPNVTQGLALAVMVAAAPVHAQIYRWVDERGTINYASQPPASAKATQLALEAMHEEAARVQALRRERERESNGHSRIDTATVAALDIQTSRAHCHAERRADCSAPSVATRDRASPDSSRSGRPVRALAPSTPAGYR